MTSVWKNVVENVRGSCRNCTTLCCRDFSVHPYCSAKRWNKRLPIPLLSPHLAVLYAWYVVPLMKAARLYREFTGPHLRPRALSRPFRSSWKISRPVGAYNFEFSFREERGH